MAQKSYTAPKVSNFRDIVPNFERFLNFLDQNDSQIHFYSISGKACISGTPRKQYAIPAGGIDSDIGTSLFIFTKHLILLTKVMCVWIHQFSIQINNLIQNVNGFFLELFIVRIMFYMAQESRTYGMLSWCNLKFKRLNNTRS